MAKQDLVMDMLIDLEAFNNDVKDLSGLIQNTIADYSESDNALHTLNRLGALARSIERLTTDIETTYNLLWNKCVCPLKSVKGGAV